MINYNASKCINYFYECCLLYEDTRLGDCIKNKIDNS